MPVFTPSTTRRSTRLRVEIPVSVTSLDRMRPFVEKCVVLIASAQGCGFRSTRALQTETPIMLSDLPGGGSVTARVANCLPLGSDGNYFLIGASLYTQGNVWGVADPPEDWSVAVPSGSESGASITAQANDPKAPANRLGSKPGNQTGNKPVNKKVWPYNLFSEDGEAHPGRK